MAASTHRRSPSNNGSDIHAKVTPTCKPRSPPSRTSPAVDHWHFAEAEDSVIGRFELDGVEGQVPDYDVYLGTGDRSSWRPDG